MGQWAAHTRLADAIFRAKAAGLRLRRACRDVLAPTSRHPRTGQPLPHRIAESITPLWTSDALSERRLQLGKAQNLRVAVRAVDGVCVPAGEVFSFWRQVGRATRRRGYVAGRELREGCLIPAVGGGLCQLSNALYAAALDAGCEIVERHAHSQTVPGSAAEQGRDATVFWNYLDLRFAPRAALRIEARLDADTLTVRFWSDRSAVEATYAPRKFRRELVTVTPRGCDSCGESRCERHEGADAVAARAPLPEDGVAAFILDAPSPEATAYLAARRRPDDALLTTERDARVTRAIRSYRSRTARTPPEKRAAALAGDADVARTLGRRIPHEAAHLIVAQGLLPALWRDGCLGGRTFDVWMTRLPLAELHARLDAGLARRPDARLLGDFRAPDDLVACEAEALAAARRILTPHTAIAALFPGRAERCAWILPDAAPWTPTAAPVIAYAGPTAARRGAWAVREAARALGLTVRLRGRDSEGPTFWDGVTVERAETLDAWLGGAACVVQPSVVEDAPRAVLYAIAAGAPTLASPACGVDGLPGVESVPADDADALIAALEAHLVRRRAESA